MACHNLAIKMINTNPKSVWCCQLQQISTALSTGKRLIFTISSFWSRCCEWIRQCSTNVARRVSSQQQWWNGRPSRNLWITLLPSQIQRVKACGENRENLPWKNLSGGRILYEPAKDLGLSLLILFDLQVPMSKVATVPKQACVSKKTWTLKPEWKHMRQILDSQLTNPSDDTFQCFFPLHLCGLGRYTWRHNMAHRDTLHNGRFTVLVIRL